MRKLAVGVCAVIAGGLASALGAGGAGAQSEGPYYSIPTGSTATYTIPTGTTTTTPVPPRVKPIRLTLSLTKGRDRRKPYTSRASGKLTRPAGVSVAVGCRGKVSVRVKRGSKTVSSRRVNLSSKCKYTRSLKVSRKGKYSVVARYEGNARLLPRSSSSRPFRAG